MDALGVTALIIVLVLIGVAVWRFFNPIMAKFFSFYDWCRRKWWVLGLYGLLFAAGPLLIG